MTPAVHPIEAESYRILGQRADLSALGPVARAMVARVVHATADLDYVQSMVVDEEAAQAGVDALRTGVPVICDVEMVRAGVAAAPACCHLGEVTGATAAGRTRTAEAMARAARAHPEGAVVVVGCAPTALVEVVRLAGEGWFRPALVVGLPVGFVGAAEAKEALRASGLPAVSNTGEKGGSAAAAAAVNALARLAATPPPPPPATPAPLTAPPPTPPPAPPTPRSGGGNGAVSVPIPPPEARGGPVEGGG